MHVPRKADTAVNLLIVEDDELDVEALLYSLEHIGVTSPVTVASDGEKALALLRKTEGADRIRKPYVVLLDMNMPNMNGIAFLDRIRADPDLEDTVVFVLTTSSDEKDRKEAYKRNVAGYIIKSEAGELFCDAVALLKHYCGLVQLPR